MAAHGSQASYVEGNACIRRSCLCLLAESPIKLARLIKVATTCHVWLRERSNLRQVVLPRHRALPSLKYTGEFISYQKICLTDIADMTLALATMPLMATSGGLDALTHHM